MNRFSRIALAMVMAFGPAISVSPALAAPAIVTTQTIAGPIQELTLKNGLKVLLKESHAAPVVTWVVTYKVGSRNEAVGWTGSTHLLEHMMFKGTHDLGKGQIAQLLQRNGARFNATTGTDRTNYFETYSSDKLEMGIRLEADRMRHSLILDSERQSEMTVVRNEMERGESSPETLLYHAVTSTAYHSHPYHHPVIGWRSDVEGVPTSRLKAFYDTYYYPNNAVAVLVGDFKTPEAVALIEKYFGALPAAPSIPPMYTSEEPQQGTRRVTLHQRGETNCVQAAWHIPAVTDRDIAPLRVLDAVMSNGVTSRLYQSLVEKQLATEAWSDCGMQHDPSLFRVGLTLQSGVSHADGEKAVLLEVDRLKTEPVTARELEKAKNQTEAGYVMANDGTSGLAMSLGEYEALGNWRRMFTLLDDIKKVTPEDLMRVAKTYLQPDNMTVGWVTSEPDGPVRPAPANAGSGRAVASATVKPLPLFDFEQRQTPAPQLTRPVRKVLSNGMTVVVLENHANPTVAVNGFVRGAGSLSDPAGQKGVASLTASMLDAGTKRHDKLAIADTLEYVGASVGFGSSDTVADLSARALSKHLGTALDVMAEELMEPGFPAEELAKLQAQWIMNIKQGEDSPDTRAARAFNHAIFPKDHPFYQLEPADQIKAVQALTVEDLKRFHAAHYGPNATTITVVGDVQPEAVVKALESRFAGWASVRVTEHPIPDITSEAPTRSVIPMLDKTNVAIVFGNATTFHRKDPDYYAMRIANYVLGGSPLSARLGIKLRDEMGLTYDARSGISPGVGASPWSATVTVNRANVETALAALHGELQRFLKGGVTADELAKAQSFYIGNQAVGLSTNAGMADSLSAIEEYGLGLDYWQRYPTLIRGVTLTEVNAAARKMIHPELAGLAIAGPYTGK